MNNHYAHNKLHGARFVRLAIDCAHPLLMTLLAWSTRLPQTRTRVVRVDAVRSGERRHPTRGLRAVDPPQQLAFFLVPLVLDVAVTTLETTHARLAEYANLRAGTHRHVRVALAQLFAVVVDDRCSGSRRAFGGDGRAIGIVQLGVGA